MKQLAMSVILLLFGTDVVRSQKSTPTVPHSPQTAAVMLAAVSRDESMFQGGIGGSKWTARGTVVVQPLAYFTSSGEWLSLPCVSGSGKACRKFQSEYLSKPHLYTVISADGKGAVVNAAPTSLSECYEFSGTGTYSGAPIETSAIAASSVGLFADIGGPRLLSKKERGPIQKALAPLVPRRLDSTKALQIFEVNLEGHDLLVVQRAFATIPISEQGLGLAFGIGAMESGRFRILRWRASSPRSVPEDERVLGTISSKTGRDYLITVVSDPESQFFRVYGIQSGQLKLIFSGGGSSC